MSEPARRVEVFTGAGRRRTSSSEEKTAIVAARYVPGETVCAVARRHGLTPQQLFTWRRLARSAAATAEVSQPPLFVSAVVEAPEPPVAIAQAKLGLASAHKYTYSFVYSLEREADVMVITESSVGVGSELYAIVTDWIYREADLLDSYREREWLETMVSRDVVYQVPLRQSVERVRGMGFSDGIYHLNETYGSLRSRVARNETPYAWAEDPPSRIRHFVTNVRVARDEDGALEVKSNLLVYRTRGDQTQPQLLSAERHDLLVREAGAWKLQRRIVRLDHTVLETHNLSLFF